MVYTYKELKLSSKYSKYECEIVWKYINEFTPLYFYKSVKKYPLKDLRIKK